MGNSIALVTGANKGIGREIARQLASVDLTVYVGSRDAARGQRAVGEIGGDARLLVLDVTDAASIASRICAATGARMLGEVFPAPQARGAGSRCRGLGAIRRGRDHDHVAS